MTFSVPLHRAVSERKIQFCLYTFDQNVLPPDAKIFDLLKLFSKDVIASIIKPIVASLRGAGGRSLSGSSLFRPCGRRGPWERGWEKEEFGARGVEERERLQRRYCLHQTDQTPLFPACVAGGFFIPFL